jgi:hypothetical protein
MDIRSAVLGFHAHERPATSPRSGCPLRAHRGPP